MMFDRMNGRGGGMHGFGMDRGRGPRRGGGPEDGGRGRGRGDGEGGRGSPRGGRQHGDGYDFWREGGGPRGRGPRMFDRGELRLVLLKLIGDAPRHGYDLIRAIEELTGAVYVPSPGVVYPTLTLLDEMGLIEEQATEGAKKRFAITDAGQAHVAENHSAVDALIARLSAVGAQRERTDSAPVRRAVGNLRTVLQQRLGGGAIDVETQHAIAALIDEAAQKVERLP